MTEQCPYLEYRQLPATNAEESDPRAYCTAAEEFVQPMRADVCNDRYDLDHGTDCEIFRDAEGLPAVPEDDAAGHDEDDAAEAETTSDGADEAETTSDGADEAETTSDGADEAETTSDGADEAETTSDDAGGSDR